MVFSLALVLSGFGIRMTLASQNEFESIPSSPIVSKEFKAGWCEFFFECLVKVTCGALWSRDFLSQGRGFITTSISVFVLIYSGLYFFSIQSW